MHLWDFVYFQGLLGSPLLCQSDSTWFQVAVITLSQSKSTRADIQVFPKTSQFGSFLKENVGDLPSPAVTASATTCTISITLFGILLIASATLLP